MNENNSNTTFAEPEAVKWNGDAYMFFSGAAPDTDVDAALDGDGYPVGLLDEYSVLSDMYPQLDLSQMTFTFEPELPQL
jgi:hypothetical protein